MSRLLAWWHSYQPSLCWVSAWPKAQILCVPCLVYMLNVFVIERVRARMCVYVFQNLLFILWSLLAADHLTEVDKTVSMKNCSSTQLAHCMKVQLLMEFMYIHGSCLWTSDLLKGHNNILIRILKGSKETINTFLLLLFFLFRFMRTWTVRDNISSLLECRNSYSIFLCE